MRGGVPRILASFVQDTLASIDAIDPELGRRVRAALKPRVRDEIENAWGATWLPISHDVELTERFFALAGEEQACDVMRNNLSATFEKPILRPMLDGALRLFGTRTEGLLRWAPRAWSLIFRDAGEMHVEAREGEASILLRGLPLEVSESRPYLLGTAAALSALFGLTQVTGSCRLASQDAGEARFELCWTSAGDGMPVA